MRRRSKLLAALLLAPLAYLALWPVPVAPVAWRVQADPGYAGPHAKNQRLARLQHIDLGQDTGPEHVALGPDGRLYVAVASGNVLRMAADGSGREVFANTGGRVLGFDFDAAGNLIAADAIKGLLSISPGGETRVLADAFQGEPIGFADGVVVASDGRIYFSDATTRFAAASWGGTFEASLLDILEQSATGRVLEYDPATGSLRVVARGISFANGVALSQDGRWLLVAETGRYRVWRIAVDANDLDIGLPSPLASVLLDNLPGYPDNLMRGLDGRIWLGFTKPRSAVVDAMAPYPFARKVTMRLPRALWPVPPAYGHVIAFTQDGRIVADLQDPAGKYAETTAVTETADRLYLQSLHADTLGWLPNR
ncbi:MAG: SMP-30/gluconolactonase/LRE family protein [Arenimonas sp.]|uniref:SMP-30/gluconolactonase/LRE family protein n=1 Tax=Arenimonas sp. TaxID=1872635 RepID=UPI0025C6F4DF|nr:SMP-30/gluconolactonase/LRE family protein [Arenimonas sp.]MBW8366472.1 SMP-30/gluconolactonase/LRE family protein [Arenimonas sp.]